MLKPWHLHSVPDAAATYTPNQQITIYVVVLITRLREACPC